MSSWKNLLRKFSHFVNGLSFGKIFRQGSNLESISKEKNSLPSKAGRKKNEWSYFTVVLDIPKLIFLELFV